MSIFFTKSGTGPDMVLMHGWGGSHNSLEGLKGEMSNLGFTVYNLDLPGFGKSELINSAMTFADYVNEIQNFFKEQNIINPILVGHSFGGNLAVRLAEDFTKAGNMERAVNDVNGFVEGGVNTGGEGIAGIVLIAASGLKPRNDTKKSLMGKIAGLGKAVFSLPILKSLAYPVRKFFYYYIVRERDFFNAGEKLRQTFININSDYLADEFLAKIKVPTLIVWGKDDTVTPLWMGQEFAKLIPGAKLECVEDARHNIALKLYEIVSKIIYNYFKPEY